MRFDFSAVVGAEIDDSDVIAAVARQFGPEEVFPADELAQWAAENGYVKREDGDE